MLASSWQRALAPALLLLAALALRVYALDFGLPFALHVDESRFVSAAVGILQTGDPHPGWFRQPSLQIYLMTAALGVYARAAMAAGTLASLAKLFQPPYYFIGEIPQPAEWLAGRALTALLGTLSVGLVLVAARRWSPGGRWIGAPLLAAGLLAFSPLHVAHSHYITADILAALLALACVLAAQRVAERGGTGDYLLAGLLAGLAASAKYNVGLVALAVAGAHLLRGRAALRPAGWLQLALAGLAAGGGFLLGTPYALLDTPRFVDDLVWELRHNVVSGHPGREDNSALFYLRLLLGSADRWLVGLGVFGLGLTLRAQEQPERRRAALVAAAFVVPFAAMLALARVHFDRFALPLLPVLALTAGYALEQGLSALAGVLRGRGLAQAAVVLVIALLAGLPLGDAAAGSLAAVRGLGERDVMLLARDWIETSVPPGESLAIELLGGVLDLQRYRVLRTARLIEHPADWYYQRGYRWFLASGVNYRPVLADGERYPQEAAGYRALFAEWELVGTIEGPSLGRPGYEVAVYRVRER